MYEEKQPGRTGGLSPFILVGFLVLLVGAIAVFFFNTASSGVTDENATQSDKVTAPAATVQGQQATVGSAEAKAPAANAAVQVIATDDPFYLNCLETPLGQDETREQRTAYCNQELQKQQEQR